MKALDNHTKKEIFYRLHNKLNNIDFYLFTDPVSKKTKININYGDYKNPIHIDLLDNEIETIMMLQDIDEHIKNITDEGER